jgi:hypothetical protein
VGYKPYAPTVGAALYAPAISGNFAPLYCVAPIGAMPIPVHHSGSERHDTWVQDDVKCPETYAPSRANTFWKKLTFTISIGSDF